MDNYFDLIYKEKYDEAEELRKKSIPKYLYKFIPLETDFDESYFENLEKDSMWLSKVFAENDPYEFKGLRMDQEKLLENGWNKDILNHIEKFFDLGSILVIGCLSNNSYQNPAMWGYYTNKWKGYCIEYLVEKPDGIHKVFYEPEIIKAASLYASTFNALVTKDERQLVLSARIFKENACLKSKAWEWENEYRILYPYIGDLKGIVVPHNKLGLKVSQVISGIHCSANNRKKLKTICEKNNMKYGNAVIREYEYGIDIR